VDKSVDVTGSAAFQARRSAFPDDLTKFSSKKKNILYQPLANLRHLSFTQMTSYGHGA
jgi:hypothetical protein